MLLFWQSETRYTPGLTAPQNGCFFHQLDSFTLITRASNLHYADIVWYFNKKMIKNTKNIKCRIFDGRSTCILKEVTSDMAGEYVCKLTNTAGTASTKAKLHVHGN